MDAPRELIELIKIEEAPLGGGSLIGAGEGIFSIVWQ